MPDDGNRYEVMDLFLLLGNYITRHRLGEAWFAPLDVVFGPMTLVEPDLLFVHRTRLRIVTERDVTGPPNLAVEVVSPSSVRTDRGRKRALHQEEGVTEYWVVDPHRAQVEVWRPGATAAQVHPDTLRWPPDSGVERLIIDLGMLFGD